MGMVLGKVNEEVPDHVVLRRADGYQIWRYPSQVAAVVYARDVPDEEGVIPADRAFTSKAFPMLARYIGVFSTPQNKAAVTTTTTTSPTTSDVTPAEKVAMTAPVVMTPAPEKVAMTAPVVMTDGTTPSDEGQCMKFLLPSKYRSVEEAPVPMNDAVKLEMVEDGRCEAVLSFSGNFDMPRMKAIADDLLAMLKRDDVKVVGDWNAQGYNSPFVLPWLKRNEVHIPVDPEPYKEEEGEPRDTQQ